MTAKIISIKENPLTLYLLLVGIVFSAILYIYCVNSSVRNVVTREETESQMKALRNKVSELEYKYIREENKITLDSANWYGLKEPTVKNFITRSDPRRNLSLRNE